MVPYNTLQDTAWSLTTRYRTQHGPQQHATGHSMVPNNTLQDTAWCLTTDSPTLYSSKNGPTPLLPLYLYSSCAYIGAVHILQLYLFCSCILMWHKTCRVSCLMPNPVPKFFHFFDYLNFGALFDFFLRSIVKTCAT